LQSKKYNHFSLILLFCFGRTQPSGSLKFPLLNFQYTVLFTFFTAYLGKENVGDQSWLLTEPDISFASDTLPDAGLEKPVNFASSLSSALNEIASVARLGITVEEALIPVSDVVRGACELLGLDPLYVANEGRFVAFVPASDTSRALEVLRSTSVSAEAVYAGEAHNDASTLVTLLSRVGGNRVLDMMSGEQLPRIC